MARDEDPSDHSAGDEDIEIGEMVAHEDVRRIGAPAETLARLLNVGPFAAPGGHETPNNLSHKVGPAPWQVVYGPSTRRLVDLADAERALGGVPVGQSGVPFDTHYQDQAAAHVAGQYQPQHLSEADVAAHNRGTLRLLPR